MTYSPSDIAAPLGAIEFFRRRDGLVGWRIVDAGGSVTYAASKGFASIRAAQRNMGRTLFPRPDGSPLLPATVPLFGGA